MPIRTASSRGVTLIDTLVGIALMLVVFLGIYAAFELSVDVISNNKARAGAIALADERMEYIRSLTYSAVGTSGGIPSGAIAQSETTALNGVTYTRRTVIKYGDDAKDGTGASDTNSVTEDYKAVKVDVAWTSRTGTRHITLVTRVTPTAGLESSVPGGTLALSVVNAASQPLSGASVSIVNASISPAVSLNTFTNASGTVSLLGAPAGSGYQITVTNTGYSTAQTYSTTAQNTNPNPGNLTVSNNQTTSGTFAIDVVGQKTIRTWTQIAAATSTDPFSDASKVATSTSVTVSGGTAHISGSAPYPSYSEVQSTSIAPSYLAAWGSLSWTDSQPAGTSIRYRVYDSGGSNLIPESQLPGNSAGFTASPINLSGVSTSTYPSIRLDAVLSPSASATPSIDAWNAAYTYGPQPLPSIAFTLQGTKVIGSGPSGTIYKYSQNLNSGSTASLTTSNLEWDTYAVTLNGTTTNYDIASSCNPQPETLSPGASMTTDLYLVPHTVNSLLVDVRSSATSALIPNATVHLWRGSLYAATSTTDSCGQTFFGGLTSSNAYSISVAASGHTTYTSATVSVSGTSRLSVSF